MRKFSIIAVCSGLVSTLAVASGCGPSTGVNQELYRAAPNEELALVGAGCILREGGPGAHEGAGGGAVPAGVPPAGQYAFEQVDRAGGGVELTYYVASQPLGPEQILEPDDPEAEVAATLELSKSDLESGQSFVVEFDSPDGYHFEAIHWGTPGGC